MKKIGIITYLILFGSLTPITTGYCESALIDTNTFASNQILSNPTNNSIIISIYTKKAVQLYYEYGVDSLNLSQSTILQSVAANQSCRTPLNNLLPNKRYFYRIKYKEVGAGAFITGSIYSFMTQRTAGNNFTVDIIADSHLYDKKGCANMMNITLDNINADRPDFLLDLGDTFGNDHFPTTITQEQMMQLHYNYLKYMGKVCHSSPFYFCLGNHEGENGYYLTQTAPNNIAVYGTLARKFYYANPFPDGFYSGNTGTELYGINRPENYYAWQWGDALFIVLDAYRYYTSEADPQDWGWTLGYEQYSWLKSTLENSTSKYKFVFAHHVRGGGRGALLIAKNYEWGGYEKNNTSYTFPTNRPGWAMPIHQLLVTNGVNIFFQGHDHLFAQEVLDGVVYQETPMPSDSTYTIGMLANADAYTSNQIDGTGHLRLSITPQFAKVEYVKAFLPSDVDSTHRNGSVAFSYTVNATGNSLNEVKRNNEDFYLSQNFPNPFRQSANIEYQVKNSGKVSIKVFNTLGEEVETIVDEYRDAGKYSTSISLDRSKINSGVYLIQMRSNSGTYTRKAIFIK